MTSLSPEIQLLRNKYLTFQFSEELFSQIFAVFETLNWEVTYNAWQVVLTSTGASSSSPRLWCKVTPHSTCSVCNQKPFFALNNRLNPSLLLTKVDPFNPRTLKNNSLSIMIDIGKTFRETVLTQFIKWNVASLHSVIYTHEHMDAIGGSDDLREFNIESPDPINVLASQKVLDCLSRLYPYFFHSPNSNLFTAKITTKLIDSFIKFKIDTLNFIPIPVYHGATLCLGYAIYDTQLPDSQFVYLSDFRCNSSAVVPNNEVPPILQEDLDNLSLFVDPEPSIAILKERKISVLILDCLNSSGKMYISHSNREETIKLIYSLRKHDIHPEFIYFTGMSCAIDYNQFASSLIKEFDGKVLPGFDGKNFPLSEGEIKLTRPPPPPLSLH